jgi:arylsulfatase A-like enzyme
MRILSLALLVGLTGTVSVSADERPNILWIITDDHSQEDVGCYGHNLIHTPNMDRLAREGTKFTSAFSAAPSCAPTRSGLITGMYPIRIGAHNQRNNQAELPGHVRLLPQYLRDAGYFCVNANWNLTRRGKSDYQFQCDQRETYEQVTDWAKRREGQPFFAQVQISEPHRVFSGRTGHPVDPQQIELPPQYPDDPVIRADFAGYLNDVQVADDKLGRILDKLDREGDSGNTIVFFFGDQGRPFPRGKQFLYDEGLKIPLIVRWPEQIPAGNVCDRLVSMLDFAPTCLDLAGLDVPSHMDGVVFLGENTAERDVLFASRDRIDDAVDRIRCLRTKRFKYIRNFFPDKPYDMNESYMVMVHPTLHALRKHHADGTLTPEQALWMAPSRPVEELYDVEADANEFHNLAGDPEHAEVLESFRKQLNNWVDETNDRGRQAEDPVFLGGIRQKFARQVAALLEKHGLDSTEELYDYWYRTLVAGEK